MIALKDILFFIGLWFIGRVDRIFMAELMEKSGKGIKEIELLNIK